MLIVLLLISRIDHLNNIYISAVRPPSPESLDFSDSTEPCPLLEEAVNPPCHYNNGTIRLRLLLSECLGEGFYVFTSIIGKGNGT